MGALDVNGKQIQVDDEGYLVNFADWDKSVEEEIACKEGIEKLTKKHWLVIDFMQKEFKEHGSEPLNKKINKGRRCINKRII